MKEARPRIWVPGVCIVEGQRVRLGPRVGWCRARGVGDWKGAAVVFDKAASPISAPVSLIDAERWPRLHAVAEACPITARVLEGHDDPYEHDASGPRRLFIAWDRRSGSGTVEMRGGDEPPLGFTGHLPGRCRLTDPDFTEQDYEDHYDSIDLAELVPLDRVVRAVSEGRIDEASIELALRLEEVAGSSAKHDAWEAWLVAVAQRAENERGTAKKIASRLRRARKADEEAVDVPIYGEVEVERLPEVHMARNDDTEPGDDAIVMEAETRFKVVKWRDVDLDWPPSMSLSHSPSPSSSPFRWWVVALIAAVVLFLLTR